MKKMTSTTLGVEPKNIKASVVTVCFNSAKTIEQTIRSVLGQSYNNIEYIVIDGGSTDGTVNIIKKYKNDIAYWVSEPDRGIYDAMNKGIAKATGDIIAFMNSDDWYAEGAIAAVVEAFDRTDADVVYGHTILVNSEIQTLQNRPPLDHIFNGMVFCHQAAFVRTKLMKNNLFDISYKIVADYAFFLEMYLQGKNFFAIDTTIAYYQMGGYSSHPWKLFQEAKRASLRLSKGRVDKEQYREIWNSFQKRHFFPMFHFLVSKIKIMSKEKKSRLSTNMKKRKLVLYGAGKLGLEVLEIMKELKNHIVAFWDSDKDKQGTITAGVPTLYPQPPKQQEKAVTILITTIKDNEGISQKLEKLGYDRGKDFFVMDTWLRWMAGVWLGKCE